MTDDRKPCATCRHEHNPDQLNAEGNCERCAKLQTDGHAGGLAPPAPAPTEPSTQQ